MSRATPVPFTSSAGGVGEKRQRVGEDPDDHLARHERDDQDQRDRERPDLRVGAHAVIVVMRL